MAPTLAGRACSGAGGRARRGRWPPPRRAWRLLRHAVGGVVHAGQEGLVALAVLALGRGEGRGRQGAAVEGSPEGDHPGLARHLPGQLEGAVHRLGARVAEEHLRVGEERAQRTDALGQGHVAGVVRHHRGVDERAGLLGDGVGHSGMAVTDRGHGDAGAEVEVAAAVDVDDPRPLAPLGDHVVVAGQDPGQRLVVAGQPRRGGVGGCRAHWRTLRDARNERSAVRAMKRHGVQVRSLIGPPGHRAGGCRSAPSAAGPSSRRRRS